MATINVPFNFNPSNLTVTTGSHTVSASEYAHCSANVTRAESLTIDGTLALDCNNRTWTEKTIGGAGGSNNQGPGPIPGFTKTAFGHPSTPSDMVVAHTTWTAYDEGQNFGTFWVPTGTAFTGSAHKTITRYEIPPNQL